MISRYFTVSMAAMLLATAIGCGSDSGTGTTPPADLAAPTGVTASATSATTATITWAAVNGATSYVIQRATGTGAATQIGTSATTTYADNSVVAGTTYTYTVAAVSGSKISPFSPAVSVAIAPAGPKVATLTGNITASRTLTADTLYVLNGYVKVKSGATLTIQPGTKIVGDTTVAGSSLWITRGAKIDAQGTAAAPIVFTSQRAVGSRAPGDWGGIIIVGNAPVNRSTSGGVATIFTEGPQGSGQNVGENYAGGTDPNDNSGTLRYVRIEFAGYAVLPDQELNALSMYAVGRGTKIEYVEALAGLDDSFEWFGGSVDTRYLVSYDSGDDHFDWTEGYNGRNQFLIALQSFQPTPRAGAGSVSTDPHGFEGDGCEIDKAGCTSFAINPLSMPVFANFTLVGPGTAATFNNIKDNNGAVIRRGSGGTFFNGIIARWQGIGWNVRDAASDDLRKVDSLTVNSVVVAENTAGNMDAATATCIATGSGGSCGTAANFAGLSASTLTLSALIPAAPASGTIPSLATIDWTPSATLATGGITTLPARVLARAGTYFGGTMAATAYVGAADPAGAKWWAGWTSYARN